MQVSDLQNCHGVPDGPFLWRPVHAWRGALFPSPECTQTVGPPCSGLPAGASGCFEQWSESVAYSPDGATATLTIIVKVTAVTGGSNTVVAKPSSGFQGQVGDSYTLRFMAPHLMVRTWTQGTFARSPSLWGNPYLCQSGLAQTLTSKCGA